MGESEKEGNTEPLQAGNGHGVKGGGRSWANEQV